MNSTADHPPGIEEILEALDQSDISSIQGVVTGLIQLIADPESTAKDLKEIIEIDPPLTARVLHLANSAYYAPRIKILDIMQAVIYVGFDAIKELALSQKVLHVFKNQEDSATGFSGGRLWEHSLATALFAKMVYRREFRVKGDEAYACGLLHDIGIIALQQFRPRELARILSAVRTRSVSLIDAENAELGFDHAALGAAITQFWNFPGEMTEAIAAHHAPGQDSSRLASTLFIADNVVREAGLGYQEPVPDDKPRYQSCLQNLQMGPQAVDLILGDVQQEVADMKARGLLNYDD